ncbi:hypothetical protein PLESTF_001871700 [Pleodorina starrii]|nr:hypothetical protein PLESTF_001871700 [Pleodorina starrii]
MRVPAQASKVVGPPRAAVLQITTCARPAASHAWAPANKKAGSQLLVPVFDASRDASPAYICPGLTHLPVSPAAVARSGMMTAAEFAGSTVVGARLEFNGSAVLAVTDLPFVAVVGLFTI